MSCININYLLFFQCVISLHIFSEESLSDAAKDVASSLGDTSGQTELELLNKLLGRSTASTTSQGIDDSSKKPGSNLR